MRGRQHEWKAVLGLLRDTGAGRGGALLVEGEAGSGKTRLLAEAAGRAAARGVATAAAAGEQWGPLGPLRAALGEVPGPAQGGPEPPDPFGLGMWLYERLRARVADRLEHGPLLVVLDDLDQTDPATLSGLHTLRRQFAGQPLGWLLARGTRAGPDDAGRLFGQLAADGGRRLELRALDEGDVAALVADELGAAPGPGLLRLAAGAGGNPALLVALVAGLREEGTVRADGGQVELGASRLPQRVRALVRGRLDQLSPQARQLLGIAAVLGETFALDDVAELLGSTPAALLPVLEEALSAGILHATPDLLTYRHALVRQAVLAAMPAPVRQALHRQVGEVLLDRGGSSVPAATHLMQGAQHGDTRALAGLDQAAREVLASSPQTAADLALRALELTDPGDPDWFARTVRAIDAATDAGRLDAAARLVHRAFERPVPAFADARLRCALSRILVLAGRPAEAVIQAEAVLAAADLAAELADRAELALLHGLAGLRDSQRVVARAEAVLASAPERGAAVVVGATTLLAVTRWESGQLAEGLRLARDAFRSGRDGTPDAGHTHPAVALAGMLADVRQLDEARQVLREVRAELESPGTAAANAAALRARIELLAGHLAEARAEASAEATAGSGPACTVLAAVELRRGDLRAASRYASRDRCLTAAQVTEARDGPVRALELARDLHTDRAVLVAEPTAAAWLVRLALGSGDRARAQRVVAAAETLARDNPGFPTVAAGAAHARGVLHADRDALAFAARKGADGWARASAAEDLGALLAASASALHPCAGPEAATGERIATLEEALAGYEASGSVRDVARVRRRLRRLGVRHRHWVSADRPVSGWGSLTETEQAVSLLVTQGWTNRQVAQQMFVSVHTVAFHLRQVFRKLDVGSRVELTRLAVEEGRSPEPAEAARAT